MIIYLASDHVGFKLKNHLLKYLRGLGHVVEDKGPFSEEPADDYPDFIRPVADAVSKRPEEVRGVVLGGSGQGEAMVANRFKGVRAAVYYGGAPEILKLSRAHNDANLLSLGARFLSESEAEAAVKFWLETPFSGEERHLRRVRKIETKE